MDRQMQMDQQQAPTQPSAQTPAVDTGLISLVLLARLYDRLIAPEQLQHLMGMTGTPFATDDIVLAARKSGFRARRLTSNTDRLGLQTPVPGILCLQDGSFALALKRDENGNFLIQHPQMPNPVSIEAEMLAKIWTGEIILLALRESLIGALRQFDIKWFIPEFVRFRSQLSEVLTYAAGLLLLQLLIPVLFQQVVDRVLVHQVQSTLYAIASGYLAVILGILLLNMARSAVLTHTTCKIDVRLGEKLFSHLLHLPLAYFENRPTGQTVARVHELDTIRQFLTGSALSLALDLPFLVLAIAVMAIYSSWLTLVVLVSIALYALLAAVLTPRLYHLTEQRFEKGARNQNFLIESVYGAETIKSMSVEPMMERDWGRKLAAYADTNARTFLLNDQASHLVQAISMLTMLGILFFGTYQVFSGSMTVGALIAFNMLAGQVSQPILRLSQLWQQFQQARVAVSRLGDILNTPLEQQGAGAATTMPTIQGRITFEHVHFRYPKSPQDVLTDVSFDISPGEIVGIIGPSGSGKSTLAKLIQRSYSPDSGQVLIDGMDLAVLNPDQIRRKTGTVLQENVLFRKTVRDNIALGRPTASTEEIIRTAQLAGADDFIRDMPMAYDTLIEEHGSNLSGGQRQRLAIARALLVEPQILIFDEATSALDYESEAAIQANMRQICAGRTVIIITHRLATLGFADRILTIEQGRLVADGSPAELATSDSFYARMLQQHTSSQPTS